MKTVEKTERGFSVVSFKDLYGATCSLQKSSLATDDAIWLGMNSGTHVDGHCMARMHLNIVQVRKLIPILEYFVKTGSVPKTYNEIDVDIVNSPILINLKEEIDAN